MATTHTFSVNGKQVSVDVEDDVRLLWVLRDLLHINGPKYGCGLNVCKACTSHINGKAFNPCSVQVGDIKPTDEITTIEGLPATVGKALHPMQQAWLDADVAQCGYCQPGQIMAAVALVKDAQAQGRSITTDDLDTIRNVCRCGTYYRIREAIVAGAAAMGETSTAPASAPVTTPSTTPVTTPTVKPTTKPTVKATTKPAVKKKTTVKTTTSKSGTTNGGGGVGVRGVVATPKVPTQTLAFTGADPAVAAGGAAAIAAAVVAARLRRARDGEAAPEPPAVEPTTPAEGETPA